MDLKPPLGRWQRRHGTVPAGWVLIGLAVLATALALPLTGGPERGRMEQRDAARISDLRTLSGDVAICFEGHQEGLPETLSPLECARNAGQLTGFAAGITYRRVSDRSFDLCTMVEFPPAVVGYGIATVRAQPRKAVSSPWSTAHANCWTANLFIR